MIGRSAGTVWSSGPSGLTSTLGSAISGNHGATGSSRANNPSATIESATAAPTGLLSDAIRNRVPVVIGAVEPNPSTPVAKYSISPSCRIPVTIPGAQPAAT